MYYLVKTNEMWGMGGSATDVKLFKKASRKILLTKFLKEEFNKAMEDEYVEYINGNEKDYADVEDIDDSLSIQYMCDGMDYTRINYDIMSDEETEMVKMLKYDIENDDEEELIRKALQNEQLYICIADKDWIMYVIDEYEYDAEDRAYEHYCDSCFEPGHWHCFKADEDVLEDKKLSHYDELLYDDEILCDINEMIELEVI